VCPCEILAIPRTPAYAPLLPKLFEQPTLLWTEPKGKTFLISYNAARAAIVRTQQNDIAMTQK
jgi:hypothetical protein